MTNCAAFTWHLKVQKISLTLSFWQCLLASKWINVHDLTHLSPIRIKPVKSTIHRDRFGLIQFSLEQMHVERSFNFRLHSFFDQKHNRDFFVLHSKAMDYFVFTEFTGCIEFLFNISRHDFCDNNSKLK